MVTINNRVVRSFPVWEGVQEGTFKNMEFRAVRPEISGIKKKQSAAEEGSGRLCARP